MNNVAVIGGGAAGLMAACSAAQAGARVTLLERNEKLGKKIYITGKGRCNVTNLCDADAFRKNVVKNPRFLFSALNAFPPSALMDWLESRGCPLVVERGNRVFPQSQKASDITRTFEKELRRLGVSFRLNSRVARIDLRDGRACGVTLESGEALAADAVLLCSGGQSYPSTGSTGDGWGWLSALGHTVYPPLPSLAGLTSGADWVRSLQGLSLKNVSLSLHQGKKKLFSDLGELLFTHFGISGPLALTASAYITELDEFDLRLDLKPGLTPDQLENRVLRDVSAAPRRQLSTLLAGLFPARLAETMAVLCGLDPQKPAGMLTREERARLLQNTKALPLPIDGVRGLAEAVVTRGGVSVKEVNPATMESRITPGLYIAGEMLDVDALTGGFNLQIAFSTGRAAGLAAACES